MELIITSIVAFAATNIDDIFVLILLFGNKNFKTRNIVIGQFLGVGALIAISFIGSFASLVIDKSYVGLLGVFPIIIGIRSFASLRKKKIVREKQDKLKSHPNNSILVVSGVTIANGGDNIAIYVPLFASLQLIGKVTMVSIFLLMIAIWCLMAYYLSKRPILARLIDEYGHIATPVILILLGLYILYESESHTLFF